MCVICLDGRKSLDNEETYTHTHNNTCNLDLIEIVQTS